MPMSKYEREEVLKMKLACAPLKYVFHACALTFISLANFTIDLPRGTGPRVFVPDSNLLKIGFARYDGCISKIQTWRIELGKINSYRPYALMANVNLIGCLQYRITTDYNGFIDVFASNRGRFIRCILEECPSLRGS